MTSAVRRDAEALADRLVDWRRALHRNPEIGLHLPATQATVLDALSGLDLEVTTGTGHSAVVARLVGARPGPTVLLRADMDALAVTEPPGEPFASERPGVMHACGHDAHTAMLLGAAHLLARRRAALAGTVVLGFQAGEEGHGGASLLIEDGVLDGVDEAYAVHVAPPLPAGLLAGRAGPTMASSTPFEVTLAGAGGHGSDPARGGVVDVAARLTVALGACAAGLATGDEPAYASVGTLHAGETANVQPTSGALAGTLRAFSAESRARAMAALDATVTQFAATTDVAVRLTWPGPDAPVMVSAEAAFGRVRAAGAAVVGEQAVLELTAPVAASEDFALVAELVPAAVVFVGSAGSGEVHSPTLRIDESCLPVGAALYAELALRSGTARPPQETP